MDLRMPVMSGVDAIAKIRHEFPEARIIVLTTYDGDEDIYRALQAGAQGYLLKDMFFEELEDAIRKVHAGARRLPPVVAERLAERMSASELTVRELEVLQEIVKGKTNKETRALTHQRSHRQEPHQQHPRQTRRNRSHPGHPRPPARHRPSLATKRHKAQKQITERKIVSLSFCALCAFLAHLKLKLEIVAKP